MLCRITGKAPMMKTIFKLLAMDSDKIQLVASPAGLTFFGMGLSRVTYLNMAYPPAAFEKFECDQEVKIGVHSGELEKVMIKMPKDSDITLAVDFENSRLLLSATSKPPKQFKFRLIGVEGEKKPDRTFACPIVIDAKTAVVGQVLDDIETVGGTDVHISAITGGVHVEGGRITGNDNGFGEFEQTFIKGEGLDLVKDVEKSKQHYAIQFIKPLITILKDQVENIRVECGGGMPMIITFDHNGGDVMFFVAPREGGNVPAGAQTETAVEA